MKKFLIALAVVAAPALAQVPTFTTSSQTYTPLDATSPGYTYALLPGGDDIGTVVQLPFAFPWFGANYSSVLVDTNGFISFDTVNCHSGCYSNGTLPSSASPNNAIFAYWDDLSTASTGTITTYSSATEFVVQYSAVDSLSSGASVNLQIHLTPSGTVTIVYGDFGTGGTSGTAGFENAAGTQAKYMLPSVGGTCTAASQGGCCTTTCDGPGAGYQIVIGPPQQADLLVDSVTVSNLVVTSGVWNFTVQGVLRNYGQTAASNFTWKAFLSTDTLFDANDLPVATGAILSIGPTATATVSSSATSSVAVPTGTYYVLIQVDPTNVVTEANEANNVGSTTTPFISGVDLVATSITGVANSGAGNVDNLTVNFTNRGTNSAGTVAYTIFVSTDSALSASDFPIYSGTRVVTGGETVNDVVAVTMPANSPSGAFHYILQVDPANLITEVTETNNTVASPATVSLSRADLVNAAVSLVDPATGLAVSTAKFGETVKLTATLSNTGGANALTYSVGLVLSTDTSLSLLADQLVCEVTGPALVAHAPATAVTVTCPLPLQSPAGAALATGEYYLFLVADSRGQVFESNKGNNSQYVGPVRITAPGPDLTVSNVTAPASAGVGEVIPVSRTLRNVGNVDATTAKYRYYASANDIITTEDIPLTIVTAPGMTGAQDGTVTLAHGNADSATELLQLPPNMASGPYYIGCIIDPLGQLVDIDLTNNALASRLVQVAPSSLQIASTALPDATVGRPFNFGLSAVGVNGTASWALSGQPGWMRIDAATGTLTGTPTGAPGVVSVVVTLTNGARQTSAGLALRVLAPSSQVAITTVNLPPIINSSGVTFTYALGAAGGVLPYSWRISAGALPAGLALSADGTITGAPRGAANGPVSFTTEVRDAVGSRDQRALTGRLVASGAISIQTLTIADALVGVDYLAQIAVQNADGSALAKPLTWSVVGTLPDGMSLNGQSEIAELSGRPAQAGLFPFSLTVTDVNGRSDSLDYTLDVYPPRYLITATLPDVLRPADTVNVTFAVAPVSTVKYAVVSGALPPGLALSAEGVLSGTVASDDTELGSWSFVVQAKDAYGAEGLAPFNLRVELAPRKPGCSATGAGPLALLGLALLALRRRSAGAVAAVLLAVLPVAARAQYQVVGPTATTYQSLPNTATSVAEGAAVALPFDFPFYSTVLTSVGFSPYGYLSTSGSSALSSINEPVPSTDTFGVRSFIAPWWDSLGSVTTPSANGLKYAVLGSAPGRIAVFEWKNVPQYDFSATLITFQVRLYETTGHIQFVYSGSGPTSAAAAVGVQGDLGNGVPGLPCATTPNCIPASFPKNSVIDFYLPADLQVASVSVPQTGYAGVAFPMVANVTNRGGRPANQVDVTFYLSTDAVLDASDVVLGSSTATLIDAGQTAQIALNASLPSNLTAGNKFIFAVVDPANTISEINENNNTSTPVGIVIGGPLADLAASNFAGPAGSTPGAMVQVTRSIRNAGNAPSAAFTYSYFLSDNPVISVSDRALGSVGSGASLAAAATDTSMDTLPLPSDLTAGNYWLGFCVNYDSSTATFGGNEITTVNDCLGSSSPITISTGTLSILAPTLPALTQFAAFGLRLGAVGGSGQYAWQVSSGALPPGVTLSAAGDLGGTPSSAGPFSFEVKVTSGTLTDTRSLSLTVSAGDLPLVLVDQVVTAAQFGLPYHASLIAVGGKPPYTWALTDATALPAGLALASDGTLEGRATQSGTFTFPVLVTDSAGATAAKELSVKVVNPSALAIATTALPAAHLDRNYQQPLLAVGGRAPYSWSVVRIQQLAQNPTEAPQPEIVGAAVTPFLTGLGLKIDATKGLTGKPLIAGLFALTLQVTDGANTVDHSSVLLQVTYDTALVITTTSLPDAFFNEPYANVKLAHNGGIEAKGITFSTPCVQQGVHPGEFTCAAASPSQQLPPGLVLAPDGTISGVANGGLGTYTFLVKLTDAAGRQDVHPLSIRVNGDFAAQKTGCTGAPAAPSLLALIALVALASRRRR